MDKAEVARLELLQKKIEDRLIAEVSFDTKVDAQTAMIIVRESFEEVKT